MLAHQEEYDWLKWFFYYPLDIIIDAGCGGCNHFWFATWNNQIRNVADQIFSLHPNITAFKMYEWSSIASNIYSMTILIMTT